MNQPGVYTAEQEYFAADLVRQNYDALIAIARAKRRRFGLGQTLATIDLVHEALIRSGGGSDPEGRWTSSEHHLGAVVLAMRHVIIDYVRKRAAEKHGGGAQRVPLGAVEAILPEFSETPEQIVAIADLLDKLGRHNPRWLQIVDARYFAGMTEVETASLLSLSDRTVRRDWQDARTWLAGQLANEA